MSQEPRDWSGIVDLLGAAGALKRLARQGWVYIGVEASESVADHSYRLALMALLLAQGRPGLDPARAVTLALIHDLPEAITGDLTPLDQALAQGEIEPSEVFARPPRYSEEADQAKRAAEEAALATLTGPLPPELARLLSDAWHEYEDNQTPEAQLVHQLDKLEALLQAYEYRREQPDLPITSFELGTRAATTDPALRALLECVVERAGPPGGR